MLQRVPQHWHNLNELAHGRLSAQVHTYVALKPALGAYRKEGFDVQAVMGLQDAQMILIHSASASRL